ncbi:Dimethylaniline monooxygenase [N-oxide-forming] 2 [Trichoplax sp. H2]|nr:Dimethylaniline monooxygenase [N-oxide-forming] 2 [Trichoplax sp. H2]|eukprot:RDD46453.1 Dimethylaniline monooxygenase [N-oxide-forming] 2 [Trichoplax sp. H2]
MKVAIVGAGVSGLTALKQCLDEGIQATVFEKEEQIGGIWTFSETPGKGGLVYRSVITNTSKDMTGFSDYPMPDDYPPYIHNSQVVQYLQMYCDHFKLNEHIQFNTSVRKIEKAANYQQSGRWDITLSRNDTNETTTETFDAVMVANGLYSKISLPHFQGVENFRGKVLHSRDYKDWKGYENKRVLVVGSGSSAVDIAVELSYHCSQVYMSTRSGAWVFGRVSSGGLPADSLLSRFTMMVPRKIVKYVLRSELNQKFDHAKYGLGANYDILTKSIVVNDDIAARIICGAVKVKDNLSCIKEHDVEFCDGTIEKDIQAIVFATGFATAITCLDSSIITQDQYECLNLFRNIFPPGLDHPTLAMIGYVQVGGAVFPVSEMQSRYVVRVFKKCLSLPSQEEMIRDIEDRHKANQKAVVRTEWSIIRVDYIKYMDELASLIGCKCNLLLLFFRDPKLALRCFFGPCTPTQFRLVGPHRWNNAKKTIENNEKRFVGSIQTRRYMPQMKSRSWFWSGFAITTAVVIAYYITSYY